MNMNQELKINPEFEEIVPPMGQEEFEQLEKVIVKEGRIKKKSYHKLAS